MRKQNWMVWLLIATMTLLMTACGGGGSGGDTQAPEASVLTPDDGETNVSRSTQVEAVFDGAMKSSTITPSSFTLTPDSGSAISASVLYDTTNNTATLTPDSNLSILTTYEAKLTTAITDLSGNPLPQTTWHFTTADGSWQGTAAIETGTGNANSPQIAIDPNGNAIAVWYQYDGSYWSIYANRYTAGSGWGTAALIEEEDGDALSPQIAIDPNGNAIAVWRQHDSGSHWSIYTNRYTPGSGWGTASVIELDAEDAFDPQIAIDPNGNAIAVWEQYDGSQNSIYANRYTAGSGWGAAALIETENRYAYEPQIAIDPNGNATVVWYQHDGSHWSIYANRYTAGSGWGTAALIETEDGDALSPQIAIDPNGNAIAVWRQHDSGSHWSIYTNRYTPGSGWGTAALIEEEDGDAISPEIAIDPNGNAVAVWHQYDSGNHLSIYANRYTPGSGWGTAAVIEAEDSNAYKPQIAIDPNGNAIAVWYQYDGSYWSIYANRYTAGSGWGTAALIEEEDGDALSPEIAIDPNGNAVAVWMQVDGSNYSIYANRFQ